MAKPTRPASIPPRTRWATVWNDGIKQLTNPTSIEARMLERMVLNLMEADAAMVEAKTNPYIAGSRGGMVMHPGFTVAARCDERAMGFARQLRLTPLARSNASGTGKTTDPFDNLDGESQDELEAARQKRRQAS